MLTRSTVALTLAFVWTAAGAQNPSSAFDRGNALQAWQHPRFAEVIAACRNRPQPFSIGGGSQNTATEPPPQPPMPVSTAIPGVIAAGQQWRIVWAWEGNNVDGPIADPGGMLLFANNDADSVMRLDPATGLATIIHEGVNTGGAVSRSRNGALFAVSRGLNPGILQLEPERKVLANSFNGEPLDCVGGVVNDLSADRRGGVYFTITAGGLFYSTPEGVVSQHGDGVTRGNGIILNPDETVLYVTNGPVVLAFDVQADGSLANQREFAQLRSGRGGDGSAVDAQGRLYVSTGMSVDVFAPDGAFLGTIPGPQGLHGVAFGGPDKQTLFGIVFYGGWGTPAARNQVIAIPTLARGYAGRAK